MPPSAPPSPPPLPSPPPPWPPDPPLPSPRPPPCTTPPYPPVQLAKATMEAAVRAQLSPAFSLSPPAPRPQRPLPSSLSDALGAPADFTYVSLPAHARSEPHSSPRYYPMYAEATAPGTSGSPPADAVEVRLLLRPVHAALLAVILAAILLISYQRRLRGPSRRERANGGQHRRVRVADEDEDEAMGGDPTNGGQIGTNPAVLTTHCTKARADPAGAAVEPMRSTAGNAKGCSAASDARKALESLQARARASEIATRSDLEKLLSTSRTPACDTAILD